MPLIQKLLQRNIGSPSLEIEPGPLDSNMSIRSSLPESAFLDILSALNPLPEFPRLLATVNEQGQTLLHLAIHLRYRELVQKLIHWGIDLNARDVNGFTALHVGYLCDDAFVIGFLEAEGATPLVLDELGRSPTELAASISTPNNITSGRDEEMVPLAVGYTNQSKQQRRLLGRALPVETQEIAFGPAAGEGHPSEYVIFCHTHNQLLTHCSALFQRSTPVIYFTVATLLLPLTLLLKPSTNSQFESTPVMPSLCTNNLAKPSNLVRHGKRNLWNEMRHFLITFKGLRLRLHVVVHHQTLHCLYALLLHPQVHQKHPNPWPNCSPTCKALPQLQPHHQTYFQAPLRIMHVLQLQWKETLIGLDRKASSSTPLEQVT